MQERTHAIINSLLPTAIVCHLSKLVPSLFLLKLFDFNIPKKVFKDLFKNIHMIRESWILPLYGKKRVTGNPYSGNFLDQLRSLADGIVFSNKCSLCFTFALSLIIVSKMLLISLSIIQHDLMAQGNEILPLF